MKIGGARAGTDLDGKLIDFGRKCEADERELLEEMLGFVAKEVEELGNQHEIAHIERIMREGTGADRQLMVWERTQDMKAVVDQIVAETNEGLALVASQRHILAVARSTLLSRILPRRKDYEFRNAATGLRRSALPLPGKDPPVATAALGTAKCNWKVRARIARVRMRWGQGNSADS